MTAIKLGVAGTHSTGKTTLVTNLKRSLEQRGLRVKRIGDLATQARNLGFPILREHTFESTLWIMTRGISETLEIGLDADIVIVDRPAFDALGYLRAALAHRDELLPELQHKYLMDLARYDAGSYDVLCKTVLDSAIALGPDRDPDPVFRASADAQIELVMKSLEIEARRVEQDAAFVNQLVNDVASMHGERRRLQP
jgi:hypothetical protein